MKLPPLQTARLTIRPSTLEDAAAVYRINDRCFNDGTHYTDPAALERFRPFAQWLSLNPEMLDSLQQPAYGDRIVALRSSGEVIGQVGYVPYLAPFDQIPELHGTDRFTGFNTLEVGLFWAIDPDYQNQGYATEAARALAEYAFHPGWWNLRRIIATADYANLASQAVMRKLGMTLLHNPLPEPHYLQVVGVLYNPRSPRT